MGLLVAHGHVSTTVSAPTEVVQRVYADYRRWPEIFPLVAAVELLEERNGCSLIAVEHRRFGRVINRLVATERGVLRLEEEKPTYDAVFVNRFDSMDEGTHFSITGEIRLKGLRKLLAPLIGPYVRRQMRRLQLEPIRRAAELEVQL
jgi:Polyketide cyclase / dehydrase and lipid transport